MEIQLNFMLFEEPQEKASSSEAVARIMIVRESKNAEVAFEEDATGPHPLE
jgi:hypothetical protein